jgi:hypothetical protein
MYTYRRETKKMVKNFGLLGRLKYFGVSLYTSELPTPPDIQLSLFHLTVLTLTAEDACLSSARKQ